MAKEHFPMIIGRKRPIINVNGIDTLIDSGAEISVFNTTTDVFELIFDYQKKIRDEISGYGGKCKGTGYITTQYELGNITIYKMPFFVPDKAMKDDYKVILATPALKEIGVNVYLDHRHNEVVFDY